MASVILVLNGPNLNMLGVRQPEVYGTSSYADVVAECERAGTAAGVSVDVRQTNDEAEMIEWIHHAARSKEFSAIVINPAGWTHTSVALADALVIPELPVIEVHISNVHAREAFRQHSFVSPVAAAVIAGCGIAGYGYAVDRAAALIGR
ncbi:3-dehydroquinate dehydratase OS=Tsukamurella paurometabola (strain ATCC 8368 / DSM / CCUG 35730/ CIP 100753 / JCM 10117 / KCTC 9821 / NBRC 16120 / NCIMB 702349 / NCTC 13040) OX=521096 GN=aroQ PE=3 SV=1 [Tsukamurella paurometabola]|uniref:3-dehydroquinate dehydratase n=1 Tax=Tsukamurella paurometabola (strain ATCC 8368 / DSM 20162 / CCUG 35730 / CIP 100753 / JCM 10117 / KCTC 9821 / NBRC 16120 / NCIMB 702349 / NCTC 13040) TaxID=521096 RepID=D5UNZ3_TSUPD|nr:type II 3-dehydroquinate dehydratase [Tsukamurella paurometabola]ADG80702.1 3-dehydroquinate dehydratase, type II [Tsukamurella paurometabola DSM 20162]SUP40627.1 3-dehydroquinate dehydratase [Tsukamurella paurometabola]